MGEISEIAHELRDEVLQTIFAVRLSLAHSAAHDDPAQMRAQLEQAQDHLAAEGRRVRALVARLGALEDEHESEDVAA
jgi:signal transduction histidine kinase